jgi:hypothetical protein
MEDGALDSIYERPSVMTAEQNVTSLTLEALAEEFARPLLPENPFPTCITACNSVVVERFGAWVEWERPKIEADLERLRERDEAPEAWELSALARTVREWRVFAAFHQLHEERWCPALLFRLATKKDLLVLCDPAADSSSSGFGERQKQVLGKRGIADRFSWAAARKMVATMGLLEEVAPNDEAEQAEEVESPPVADVAGDGAPGAAEAAVVEAAAVEAGEASPEEPSASGGEPPGEETPSEREPDGALPPLRVNRVWSALPTYTKKQLEAVYERFGVGLWSQFGDRFYSSMRKAEMLEFVQRVVRHHACLDAAHRLTDRQLDELHDWMRFNLGRKPAPSERYQCDDDLRTAARLFGDFQAGAALSRDGHGLSLESWNRYRKAELRRIAAFCYHRYYESASAEGARPETAEMAAD